MSLLCSPSLNQDSMQTWFAFHRWSLIHLFWLCYSHFPALQSPRGSINLKLEISDQGWEYPPLSPDTTQDIPVCLEEGGRQYLCFVPTARMQVLNHAPLNTAATAMELLPSFIPSYSWNGWGLVYAEKVFFSPHTHDNSQCQTCVTPPFQKLGPRFDGGGQSLFLISAWKCLRTFHFFIILDIFLPNPKESVKDLVQLLNSFSKASGYKVNLNKSE